MSLPEYRALRGEGSILDAIRRPELAAELTLQPVRRYGVDAAILYSDIVVPVAAIGFGVDVAPGTGPVVDEPFRSSADLDRLRPLDAERDTPYVLETVAKVSAELPDDVPLIGFAGAPFTVASYLDRRRTFAHVRRRPRRSCTAILRCGMTCSTVSPISRSRRCGRRSSTARAPCSCSTVGPAR